MDLYKFVCIISFSLSRSQCFSKSVQLVSVQQAPRSPIFVRLDSTRSRFSGTNMRIDLLRHCHDLKVRVCDNLFSDQPIVTSFVCSVFTFAFSCYNVSLSFVYIMRFGCVYDLNFMEEKIGESIARIAVASITVCASLGIVLFMILSGDFGSGPGLSLRWWPTNQALKVSFPPR